MFQPYIGITGFMDRDEVEIALASIPNNSSRKLMVGVLVSGKTVNGFVNSLPHKFPKIQNISEIFIDHPLVMNLIHFACADGENLLTYLEKATELGGENLHGFQLNMVWPDHEQIIAYKAKHPDKIIILQISPQLMGDATFPDILWTLPQYYGIIDGMIFDHSRGTGQALVPDYTIDCLSRVKRIFPNMSLVVGGGLGPETMNLAKLVVDQIPDVSIDAEGKLRIDNNKDPLDKFLMQAYLWEALKLFGNK